MSEFATAGLTRPPDPRGCACLRPATGGDIGHDRDGERCLLITVHRCEGTVEQEVYSLFSLARELEALLS